LWAISRRGNRGEFYIYLGVIMALFNI